MKPIPFLGAAAALCLLACTAEPEVIRERRAFTQAQLDGCPAHPFKEEFRHIKKVAAGAALELDVKIYDYRGYLINAMQVTAPAIPPMRVLWSGKDSDGKPVPSGYYLWAVTELSTGEEQVQCTFYVHPDDNAKLE